MRGAAGGSGKHFPFRIIPEPGQVLQYNLNAEGEQPPDVFDNGVFRPDFFNDTAVFIPQSAPCPRFDAGAVAGGADILAGKSPAQNVNLWQLRPFKVRNIVINGRPWPMPRKNRTAKRINLAKEFVAKARPRKTQVAKTGPTEQAACFQYTFHVTFIV
jgi:hypothetical protein